MYKNYQTVDKTEMEDFINSCKQFNLDPSRFVVKEHDVKNIPLNNGGFHPVGKITISFNKINFTYASGHGSKWPAEFHMDLEAGKFTPEN